MLNLKVLKGYYSSHLNKSLFFLFILLFFAEIAALTGAL